jgi:L-alanine-DL-glutamate epimerase-like enolase superfamily enzyme
MTDEQSEIRSTRSRRWLLTRGLLAAGVENGGMVEVDVRPSALRSQLLDADWRIVDGRIPTPRGPGLGVVLDQEVRSRFLLAEEVIDIG